MSLDNQIAVVTGASRGIGKAIALTLGQQGAFVIGTATSDSGAEAISAYMNEAGINGVGKKLDVSDDDAVNQFIKDITAEKGAPTILVNNAGITKDNLSMRMSMDEWNSVINTNLTSVFRMSKACLKGMMKARTGRIISIASVVGAMGNAGQTNYAAAKAGIMGFSKSLAREVAARNISVNVIAPGFIETDMTKALPEDQRDTLMTQIPMKRLGQVEDIAATVAFLASAGAGYITGETIHVNGGMYMA
ncbi:MAG: 3-oxoacyl-ACP reductase FabG [Gammaproteobacteria bacterium]|nr:3-oxoacyl-ACP reductase FabG [Gammaproteobacteria bacterium]